MRTKPHLTWDEYCHLVSLKNIDRLYLWVRIRPLRGRIAIRHMIQQSRIEQGVWENAFPSKMHQFCDQELDLEPGGTNYIHRYAWRALGEWKYPEPEPPKPSLFRRALNFITGK